MKRLVFSFYLMIIIIISDGCELNKYFKNQQALGQKRFVERKNTLISLGFVGNVISKKYCKKCPIDEYKYLLIMKYHSKDSSIEYSNGIFYAIDEDTLKLSVTEKIYSSVALNDSIKKENGANKVKINGVLFPLLSDKESEWFSNQ